MDGIAREQAIYQALKAAAEVAAALQARLIEEHNADPERAAAQSTFTTSLKLLRQARERFGQGLRAAGATSPSLTRSVCATDDQQAHLVTCQSAARRCVQPFALREGVICLASSRPLPMRQPMTLTFSAWGPFWPCVMSNSTFCPSSRLR